MGSKTQEVDDFTALMESDLGYLAARRLADGTYVGIQRLLFTTAVCIGVTPLQAYQRRYCYDCLTLCIGAYHDLKTGDDVPEGWVAKRGTGA